MESQALAPMELISSRTASLPDALSPNTKSSSSPSNSISVQVTSCRCTSVRCRLTGWPSPMTATEIFALDPLLDLPSVWESCPLLHRPHLGGLVQSSNGAKHSIGRRYHRALRVVAPSPAFAPPVESSLDRVPRPESVRQVSQGSNGSCNPEHNVHKRSIILGCFSRVVGLAR